MGRARQFRGKKALHLQMLGIKPVLSFFVSRRPENVLDNNLYAANFLSMMLIFYFPETKIKPDVINNLKSPGKKERKVKQKRAGQKH